MKQHRGKKICFKTSLFSFVTNLSYRNQKSKLFVAENCRSFRKQYLSWVCQFDIWHLHWVFSLSAAPCRLPPGSAGQLHPGVYILHPRHLCVCGSALHPGEREEVHNLRHLPVPCLWVYYLLFVLIPLSSSSVLIPLLTSLPPRLLFPQASASWSQPQSTQTSSTKTRSLAGTVTASSWRGFPSPSRSSPPSLTLCYVKRPREADSRLPSTQFKTFSWIYPPSCICFFLLRWSDLSCWGKSSCTLETCPSSQIPEGVGWSCSHSQSSSIHHWRIWVNFSPEFGSEFLEVISGFRIFWIKMLLKSSSYSGFKRSGWRVKSVVLIVL